VRPGPRPRPWPRRGLAAARGLGGGALRRAPSACRRGRAALPATRPRPPRPTLPTRRADARYSAACFTASSALFLSWLLAFTVGGPRLLGPGLFGALDATRLDVWGILTGG
jgi:hypothetical protein